ncbi:MAG: hypothetical protein AB1755_03960 [Candidatus Omnitrophota bacterium]
MMKLKLSLRSLAKLGLLLNLFFIPIFFLGCTNNKNIPQSKTGIDKIIVDTCKQKYNIDVTTRISGQTLWIYLPLEDIIEKAQKEEKFTERYSAEKIDTDFAEETIKIDYLIRDVPETEKTHQVSYTKDAKDKINRVWKVIHSAIFDIKHSFNEGMQFFCFVIADIKNGFEVKQVAYVPDLKKISYGIILGNEFQHRTVTEDLNISFDITGDKTGKHLEYHDITLNEFLSGQIKQRIKQKFQRPEVDRNIDIDQEIIKTTIYVLKVYDFKDFSEVEFNNLLTNKNSTLGKTLIWKDLVR